MGRRIVSASFFAPGCSRSTGVPSQALTESSSSQLGFYNRHLPGENGSSWFLSADVPLPRAIDSNLRDSTLQLRILACIFFT